MSEAKTSKKRKIGRVVSDKMNKTVTVVIEWKKSHPLYGKKFNVSKKIKAHDADDSTKIGDVVEIEEYKPVSKSKSWRVLRKIS